VCASCLGDVRAWVLAMLVPTNGRAIVDDPAMTGIHVTK
jgi:hypothetical protein